jgi:enoyl-CoA hydratase/carnithine racemase
MLRRREISPLRFASRLRKRLKATPAADGGLGQSTIVSRVMTETREPFVRIERHEGNVAVLRLDRPKVNAISPELTDDLSACVAELNADLPGAVIVYGGEKIFAAGADIARFGGPDDARVIGIALRRALDGLAALPRIVIAAVAGYALGGGCELSMACDLRIAADTATFGQPEILLGIIPGAGGTQRLSRLVGPSRAKDIALSGRQVKADEALRIGLCDRVVPAAELFTAALAWAQEFARGPLTVQGYAKRAIDAGLSGSLSEGLTIEQDMFVASFRTEDSKIGIKSFLENGPGKAQFTGK